MARKDVSKILGQTIAEAFGVFLICYACGYAAEWSIHGGLDYTGSILINPAIIFVLIALCGDISGAHFNPAVTLVIWMSGL